jgi:hypothetical protein
MPHFLLINLQVQCRMQVGCRWSAVVGVSDIIVDVNREDQEDAAGRLVLVRL